jgi:hypothetical protein
MLTAGIHHGAGPFCLWLDVHGGSLKCKANSVAGIVTHRITAPNATTRYTTVPVLNEITHIEKRIRENYIALE